MGRLRVEDLDRIKQQVTEGWDFAAQGKKARITVHMGTCGIASGAKAVYDSLLEQLQERGQAPEGYDIKSTGCVGFCGMEPILTVERPGEAPVRYRKVDPDRLRKILDGQLFGGEKVPENFILDEREDPFFQKQKFVVLRNRGRLDPESIDEYIARDGYQALVKVLFRMKPEEVVEEVLQSGLRGRGGAGFPTGLKWKFCRQAAGAEKFVLCNADEGDPGAYMDRSVLESDPHSVLEGMVIAARAIGATQGYIYCRAEYPLALETLNTGIRKAREYGLLGQDILGSGFSFDIDVYAGAGAFVCGEETALMASVEGKRGTPRPRPPFPANQGLWNKPTILNNVETLSNIPNILREGAAWYSAIGYEKTRGTKVFALTGAVKNVGLVEVPAGTSVREIVFEIGGGIPNKRKFKAAQLGGPSGGCLPEEKLDTPTDYEALTQAGAIMGSGGMIVMDETTCMVDMARFFMDFCQDESCGKCTPCREGTRQVLKILTRITQGEGRPEDLPLLEELSATIKDSALCGLGQTAPNPVLTTLRYFRHEYEAHILNRECPAHACVALVHFEVIDDHCTQCGMCFRACPAEAVVWQKKENARIDKNKCVQCMSCIAACRFDAIH
jgi:NADH:ubiquinone oxidoreductase subunit F (NADH-binding)/(2Fe-2S) ferredoxin/Pyruvate/2-oxoacid:ferredoxin oxidoreductase delta subunit